jgi:hypothetical protein
MRSISASPVCIISSSIFASQGVWPTIAGSTFYSTIARTAIFIEESKESRGKE